jgi:hypothetical protein
MTVRHGATDSQIADALLQSLPHLSDPDYLQSEDKHKGKHAAHQGMKSRKTVQAAQPQPPWLAADAFAAALSAIPASDWWRTWAADDLKVGQECSRLAEDDEIHNVNNEQVEEEQLEREKNEMWLLTSGH